MFSLGLTAVRVGCWLCIRVRRLEAANQANWFCVTIVRIDVALCHRASIAGLIAPINRSTWSRPATPTSWSCFLARPWRAPDTFCLDSSRWRPKELCPSSLSTHAAHPYEVSYWEHDQDVCDYVLQARVDSTYSPRSLVLGCCFGLCRECLTGAAAAIHTLCMAMTREQRSI